MSTPKIVQQAGGNTALEDSVTPALRQIRVDTSRVDLRVGDGATLGGKRIPNIDAVNALITAAVGVLAVYDYNAIGSYLLASNAGATTAPGVTIAGSSLTPAGVNNSTTIVTAGGVRSGTWRAMGNGVGAGGVTLWARTV